MDNTNNTQTSQKPTASESKNKIAKWKENFTKRPRSVQKWVSAKGYRKGIQFVAYSLTLIATISNLAILTQLYVR